MGWHGQKLLRPLLSNGTLIFDVLLEELDELSSFYACWCKFRKVKNCFDNFWVVMIKKGHGTLISQWMNLADFLHAYSGKLKVT